MCFTPNVTRPGPLAFGLKPSILSFSVGSDLYLQKIYYDLVMVEIVFDI